VRLTRRSRRLRPRLHRCARLLEATALGSAPAVPELAGVRVEQSDLLLARVQIASDENHEFSLHRCDVVVLGSAEATRDVWLFS